MLKQTKNKVDEIMYEISHDNNMEKLNSKTIDEVLGIMLGNFERVNAENQEDTNNVIHSVFNMEELERWKKNNNKIYEVAHYRVISSKVKFIGKLIVIVRKIIRKLLSFYIVPIVDDQNSVNTSLTSSINALYNNEIITEKFINDFEQNIKLSKCLSEKTKQIESMKTEIQLLNEKVVKLELLNEKVVKLELLNEKVAKLELLKENVTNIEQMNNTKYSDINETIRNMNIKYGEEIDYISYQIQKLKITKTVEVMDSLVETKALDDKNISIDYFRFENKFRGSRENIKSSQSVYLKYFIGRKNVIDLGCGRGEFLELLKENGINALGVDLYEDFVGYCQYKKLNVELFEATKYLSMVEDESIDGMFCSQVVEHLTVDQILCLCDLAYRKLKSDNYIIIETPNPTSLAIYRNWFYVDPTHNKPIHPKFLEFAMREAGFTEVEILYTESSKEGYRLPIIEDLNINNVEQFNDGINLLSDIMFGSQDYALIAKK